MLYLSVYVGKKFKQRFFDPGRLPKNAVHFFVPGDLDLQTRLSEGPNMSSMWISCKSVQRFRRFLYTNKNHRLTAPKTVPSADLVHCMWQLCLSVIITQWKWD